MDADEAVSKKDHKSKEKSLPFKKQEFVKGSDKKATKKAASSSSSDVSI